MRGTEPSEADSAGGVSVFASRTTTRLLDALHDPGNEPVWSHLDHRFRPVIAGLARRLGLRESDADEVAQQTLAAFVRAYREGRYDRTKGRLSSWILGIAHHTTMRLLRDGRRGGGLGGPPASLATADVADETSLRSIWMEERDRAILARAMDALRNDTSIDDRTLLAFEFAALRDVPAAEAARQCGMSVDQVYVAKSRIIKRLRSLVEDLTLAFEEDT